MTPVRATLILGCGCFLLVVVLVNPASMAPAAASAREFNSSPLQETEVTETTGFLAFSPGAGFPARDPFQECPLDEAFEGSLAGWTGHGGSWEVTAGYLFTSGVEGISSSASYPEECAHFDYQVRMWRSGCDTCANRIIFRGIPEPLSAEQQWYQEYLFQYTRNGEFSFYKRVAGGPAEAVVPWITSLAVNKGDAWNTLRVQAYGSNLKFYINDVLVWSGQETSLGYGRVGVGMYRAPFTLDNELRVDWARLCLPPYMLYLPVMRK